MYAPSSYITRYEANSGFGMVGPWRHEDWRVRAIWFKREYLRLEAYVADCSHPSDEYDGGFDGMIKADEKHQNVITSQWLHRLAARAQLRAA